MPNKFHGKQRDEVLQRLTDHWLPGGSAVAILQGFPGCGKSQLAAAVAARAHRSLDPLEPQEGSTDPTLDLLIDLAFALDAKGIPGLVQEFDKGVQADLGKALLEILRNEKILVVVDEFQRLLPKESTVPPAPWATVVEHLNNSTLPFGRLLLISSRSIKTERWCETCEVQEIRGLPDQEAEVLFTELLESKSLGEKVPPEQRRAIAHRLSGNPRALKTLVTALRTDSLTDLLPEAPDLGKPGDVVLDPRLLEDFERELLERALPKLDANLLKFMRWLSVHRRPFQKEALAQFTGGLETPEALRQQLFDRFLLEQAPGGDTPHQLAREISVNRLRADRREWVQAHNLAANYHLRRFEARRLTGASTLAASYAELRHHLYEAGRIDEISKASERLTKYALSQIGLVTPVPTNKEVLEERITLLSAIPDGQRPKVLEYHLALCLKRRGGVGDQEKALKHAREATGPHMFYAVWMLRLDLEHTLHGTDSALPVLNEALRHVPAEENAFALYQRGSEILTSANRGDEAINLLEKGIAVPGMTSLSSLYQSCAELMAKANRLDDAINLLEKGIAVPGMTSLSSLYQSCAELMAKANRPDDAINLLEKGIGVGPAVGNLVTLYQAAIELTGKVGDYVAAQALVAKGLTEIRKGNSRHKIAETGLRVFSARRDTEVLRQLLGSTGAQQLDPPQRALAEYLLTRVSDDWAKAAEVASKRRTDFPNYTPLRIQEADARLALGQVTEAADLMREHRGEHHLRDNPVIWFKAYVSLLAGQTDEARALAVNFAPYALGSASPLDEAELLRLWSSARSGMNSSVEDSFPGLAKYLRKRASPRAKTEETLAVQVPTKQPCVLAVATEWDSKHGGLSTFNRELCGAMASTGARVVCYVPQATSGEIDRAKGVQVALVEAPKLPGVQGVELLYQRPPLPPNFVPDIIIGHDSITGAVSVALARDHYASSKRVLFIHTSPEEIEWHKEPRKDSTSATRAAKRKQEQIDLANGCDLVVAVGPHLKSEFGTDLHGAGITASFVELTPGLPERPFTVPADLPTSIRCLILGRVEDYQLKGLDLAAKAFGRVAANWKQGNAPKLIVRGAPTETDDELRKRLGEDSAPHEIDVVVRYYSSSETEIRNDIREASLVLMPSKKEGFGLVGLEAIALGVPTLITANSGLAKTLRQHAPTLAEDCILPVTGDAAAKWAGQIELILTRRDVAFARAAALREQLAAKLDWKQAAADLLEKLAT